MFWFVFVTIVFAILLGGEFGRTVWLCLVPCETGRTGREFEIGLGFASPLEQTVVDFPSEATKGTPSREAIGSYSFPSKFASKNFLNHWTNSKLSWNFPLTSFSTGIIY